MLAGPNIIAARGEPTPAHWALRWVASRPAEGSRSLLLLDSQTRSAQRLQALLSPPRVR
jgi:hypothetical protein